MELWADIKGYEGIYQVSTFGNVRSLGCIRIIKGFKQFYSMRLLKQSLTNSGYLSVSLWKDGRKRTSLVHRIIADTFITNPYHKDDVNHINGNKNDNSIENLEWCTKSENMVHAFSNGLIKKRSNRKTIFSIPQQYSVKDL